MGPEIETLKDHPQSGPYPLDLPPAARLQPAAPPHLERDFLAVYGNAATIRRFQEIDASEKGAFAGARRADDRNHIGLCGLRRDTLENLLRAEAFMEIFDAKSRKGLIWHAWFRLN
jgi:hypothetical protein